MPCSAAAQQRHKIIRNGVALVGEESVSGLTRGSRRGINQENPPMRIYIIGNDGIMLCREAPVTVNEGEIAVASKQELRSAQRQAAADIVERAARCRETEKGRRPRGTDRSAVVGDRGVARPGGATRREAPVKAGRGDCNV